MLIESGEKDSNLHDFFGHILSDLGHQSVVRREFGEFAKFIPGYDGGFELNRDDLEYLSRKFECYQITSQPRVKKGFIKRGIDASIYLYRDQGAFDHNSENYRYALAMLQVAVIMARVDGVVSEEEITGVTTLLNQLKFLGERERIALHAHAHFLMQTSIGVGGGEQIRSYLKAGINKDRVIEKIRGMSHSGQKKFLEAAKEIAIADGVLDKHEVQFLQEIYRALDMPARSARTDLEKYASERYVNLKFSIDEPMAHDLNAIDEIDDVLGKLLIDFDDL